MVLQKLPALPTNSKGTVQTIDRIVRMKRVMTRCDMNMPLTDPQGHYWVIG